jgi:integrase
MSKPRTRANGEGSIFPYRNGYAAYVWVTKPDGTRGRKWAYGKTREQVHGKWLKLHQRSKEGPVATSVPTVAEYLTYWLDEIVKPNLAPLTYATRETLVRLYITPGVGGKRLDRLQVRDVQTWINTLPKTCQCCAQGKDARRRPARRRCCALGQCCGGYPSATTVADVRRTLRTALAWAIRDEWITRNVAALVKLPSTRRKRRRAWSSDEARRFLESARSDQDPLYAAYVLVLVLGLRKGEVLGLVVDDFDPDAAELSVGFQLQRVGRQLLHRETKTEASDQEAIPLPDICLTALRNQLERREADRLRAGAAWQGSRLVFTTRYGREVDPRNFNRSWDARIAKAAVRRITVHDARRTCATLLVDLDVHPRVIMRILRHANFKVTMEIYSMASTGATREALKRLGDSLDGQ